MMTDESFAALAKLLRLGDVPRSRGARLVLVDGLRPSAAARLVGITPQSLDKSLVICKRGVRLASLALSQDKAESFDALAQLLRLQEGPVRECARQVLVEGAVIDDAAQAAGVTTQAVTRCLQSCSRGLDLVHVITAQFENCDTRHASSI